MNYYTKSCMFAAGLGAGVALTLLCAPLSGPATRKLIGRKAKEGEDWVKGRAAAAQDYVATQGADLRDRARGAAEALVRG